MPSFTYTARDKHGSAVSASIEAAGRREALRILSARGLKVSTISEAGGAPKKSSAKAESGSRNKTDFSGAKQSQGAFMMRRHTKEPRRTERLPFLQSLYDLTSSGLSAGEAVRLLSVRLKDPALRSLCQGLWERISEGAPLSRAMGAYPEVFDTSTLNLIAAGEATGSLNDTLSRLIAHLTEQAELRRKLISDLAYPVFMLVVAGCVILFFMFYLLPKMQNLLSTLGGKLPTSTKILIGFSDFSLHYGAFLLVAAIFSAISFWRWRRTDQGRRRSDAWLLRVPLVGSLVTSQTVLAISQTLSVLLENGITTAEALKMTERQIVNVLHREAFAEASGRVLEGEALSSALARTNCFPDLVLDRLAVGENTGNIVPSLKDVAKTYQKHISLQLSGASRVLSSFVMICVFSFVGFIAFAIVSAVFTLSSSFKMG